MKSFIAIIFIFIISLSSHAQEITPMPVKWSKNNGPGFEMDQSTLIMYDDFFTRQAGYFAEEIAKQCGLSLQTMMKPARISQGKQILLLHDSILVTKPEMYLLEVNNSAITLRANSVRGMINGIQSLMQLLPLQKMEKMTVPSLQVMDYPRFAYRGMHLDVVRHFFPLSYIKNYIDYLVFHKFNTFHWHLTDDQGWRIEILSYPKLNTIGSWRDSTLIGHFKDTPARYDRTRYGGYYTREEVKDILAYADIRGITVIPEIDIPGHSRATITAYPEFSTDPAAAWGVAYTWGMYNRQNNVLAPNPETFRFLRTVFHEIADLFPSPYIHLGGDECSKLWWKKSDSTQAFMRRNGLKDEIALQTFFIEQVSKYLQEKNKKVLGWHEIMEGKLDTSTIVMNWSNDEKAVEAATKGFSVIMTPGKPYYFDHYQSKDPKDSLSIHGYNSLESVYRYDPLPNSIVKKGLADKILGGQANVWTEYMEYPTKVDYMIFPRMTALSESLWTPAGQKDYQDFLRRLKSNIIPRYQYWNSSWFPDFEKWTADK
jgi:hexosaminidase